MTDKIEVPDHLIDRLKHHAEDKANTAFARSAMREACTLLREDAQQPAAGEEIMVNTPYDVFTLPLQPSGLDGKGPRFVVHVPGPEQPAAVDEGSRSVTRQLLHWGGVPVYVTGTVTTSPGNWSLIDAAPAAPEADLSSDERVAALCDLSYRAGLKAGWNYCADDDQTGFARSMESARGAVAVLAAHRKQGGEQ